MTARKEDKQLTISLLFEPCDLWIGAFWDAKKRRLYILPLPCFGIVIQFEAKP